MKTFKQVAEEFEPKFQRATKTDVHYTGTINGKTYVVPHSFHGNHDVLHGTKVTPIRYAHIVSPNHILHNNPTLSPEEIARVNQHIKDIHPHTLDEETIRENILYEKGRYSVRSHPKGHFEVYRNEGTAAVKCATIGKGPEPHLGYGRAKAEADKRHHEEQLKESMKNPKLFTKDSFGKVIKPVLPRIGGALTETSASKEVPEVKKAEKDWKKEHTLRKEDAMVNEEKDVFAHHQTQIAKKTLRMPDAMLGMMGGPTKEEARAHLRKQGWSDHQINKHEHAQFVSESVWNVTDHLGNKHEVEAKSESKAFQHAVTVGGLHPEGVPMTQWNKVKVEKKTMKEERLTKVLKSLHERQLTGAESKKKEEIVHGMKKKVQGFKERYGSRAKEVMYATATKQGKKLAEDTEQLNEDKVKTINSHVGMHRWHHEVGEPVGYISAHHMSHVPSPYAYSPSNTVYHHKGKNVVAKETSHKHYEIHEVPVHAEIHASDEEATNEYMKHRHSLPLEESQQLDEMVIGAGSHKVIKAFLNKQSASSKKLSTDGKTLDGNWMGGNRIAHHEGGKVHLNELGSKASQQVHKAIKKHLTYGSGSDVPHYQTELHESKYGYDAAMTSRLPAHLTDDPKGEKKLEQGHLQHCGKCGRVRVFEKGSMNCPVCKTEKVTEEVEQIDELSRDTMLSYVRGAVKNKDFLATKTKNLQARDEKSRKRTKGILRATERLEEAEQLNETFMGTYKRNESMNRHTANIVHLAKHFGTKADQAEAKFYSDELKKHGHQPHHEAAYKLHEKLWPLATAAHTYREEASINEGEEYAAAVHPAIRRKYQGIYGKNWQQALARDKKKKPLKEFKDFMIEAHMKYAPPFTGPANEFPQGTSHANMFKHHRAQMLHHMTHPNQSDATKKAYSWHVGQMNKHFLKLSPDERAQSHGGMLEEEKVCARHGKPIDPMSGKSTRANDWTDTHRKGYCQICNVGHKEVERKKEEVLKENIAKVKLSPAQKEALEAYKNAERQEDRYMGSVFVTPHGQRDKEEKTKAAYDKCKRLGMGVEHGL